MNVRSILAAMALAIAASAATAAIGDLARSPVPDGVNFPRPMPGRAIAPEKLEDFWQSLGDWLRPKLGQVMPYEHWIGR